MGKVIAGMTISLDGFINDRNGSVERLYPDLESLRQTEMLQESIRTTGAAVMGRHAYNMAQGDLTGYEYQVPIFVLTHHPPQHMPKGVNDKLSVTFVTDGIDSAIRQATAAAGDKVVQIIGGADTFQQCMKAGLADELHLGIIPVLLGEGLLLFGQSGTGQAELEQIRILESPGRTDIQYRILK